MSRARLERKGPLLVYVPRPRVEGRGVRSWSVQLRTSIATTLLRRGPLCATELAEEAGVSIRSIWWQLDCLLRDRLITRVRGPGDGLFWALREGGWEGGWEPGKQTQ